MRGIVPLLAAAILTGPVVFAQGRAVGGVLSPAARPDAIVDLRTANGVRVVSGEWRHSDARIVDVAHREPGPDLKPSGAPNRTRDLEPKAGLPGFDASSWEPIAPDRLESRCGSGRLSFHWYRFTGTIPERVGAVDTKGATVVFEIVVDDYAEVWVNGAQPVVLGAVGGPVVHGWNAPNRVIVTRDARPGQRIEISVLGANGPLSNPPANFIWVRSATLEIFPALRASGRQRVPVEVTRIDARIDALVPRGVVAEKVADGLEFGEGPVWHPDGHLLFSDPNTNLIWRFHPDGDLSVYRTKSGYAGVAAADYAQPGSNGLALDREGRLTICEHGNRRVTRLEKNGVLTVLADAFEGRRLNSPNDLTYRSDGALFFTDPPFGLPRKHADPSRELPFSGVFCLANGRLGLVSDELSGPNGLAFSPDEKFLYVSNWDESRRVVMRYEIAPDGTRLSSQVFFELQDAAAPEAFDGLKVDPLGNVYVAGPGGIFVLSAEAIHLGTIRLPMPPANFVFGGEDARTLYVTARSELYRMRLPPLPRIVRLDPRLDAIVPRGVNPERIASGLEWVEGPAWNASERALYFTDIPRNRVYRWKEDGPVSIALEPSGYTGSAPFGGAEPGANGLAFDGAGRLILCQHGDRRVARLEQGAPAALVERFEGRRLNSPNDVAVAANGDLFFTDPPFGLPKWFDDPARELPFCGVYRLSAGGGLALLTKELEAPNGVALSPDQRTLYVTNALAARPVCMAYSVSDDGRLGDGEVFFDFTRWAGLPGSPDGIEVGARGHVFVVGPAGVYVVAPDGSHLGTIDFGVATSNCCLADGDATLFVTASDSVWRLRLATPAPEAAPATGTAKPR